VSGDFTRLDTGSPYHGQYLGIVRGGRRLSLEATKGSARKFFVFAFKLQGLAEAACTLAGSNTAAPSQLEGSCLALNRTGPSALLKNRRGRV
jgi:hypothetical protein